MTFVTSELTDSFDMSVPDMPENAPESCPGTSSADAGKVAACEGCPNQDTCVAGLPRTPDPAVEEVRDRMSSIHHKILILSGKGGVGKTTFTAQMAFSLAADQNTQVAVLDVDVCGPSIPLVMGLEGEQVHQSGSGWSPVYVEENLGVMSIGFLLSSPEDAVIWRGPKKNGLIKQFLRDVNWGEVDYLLIDTPPGTSDEHLSLVQYLSSTHVDGAIVVTTPQEVALMDVRREINFCRKVNLPILGVVENMSGFICPKCTNVSRIFPPSTGGAEKMAGEMGVAYLGGIELDPRLGQCCDSGKSFISEFPDSRVSKAYQQIVNEVKRMLSSTGQT